MSILLSRLTFVASKPLRFTTLDLYVNHGWLSFGHLQVEKSFCTLQHVYEEILLCNGNNTYVLPHIGKDKVIREQEIHHLRIRARHASAQTIQKKQDLVVDPVLNFY